MSTSLLGGGLREKIAEALYYVPTPENVAEGLIDPAKMKPWGELYMDGFGTDVLYYGQLADAAIAAAGAPLSTSDPELYRVALKNALWKAVVEQGQDTTDRVYKSVMREFGMTDGEVREFCDSMSRGIEKRDSDDEARCP